MDSIHERYLGGEIVYSGKLDSIQVRPGYYRAQIGIPTEIQYSSVYNYRR